MYVLIDMEWVTNRHGNHWPTQLAAIRVDEEWQTVDSFSVLFRPKDITFQSGITWPSPVGLVTTF